ncbi:vacuolar carboxypeptidase Cps1, putative [Talaromyces stipitatus ATCC 10500]|uniref:Vacuolar carboxypeptidase Cps1, putative n=1 Tax=Talaromyces stipitatus (strain ATCC 10500 / CBS 375.48 / QM 6759 / NRRL 1006) TaxID=441959 RepID=B8MMJ9_TALSN|nr:vacuolar carboxypeptidase Cps1, putative [Talaromyces stipitatus ATCC 10500]EED13753.1 vacuolar carboxypeptidase Cps1, putative [Talaromyces stipitatus ATCC 10500]
MRVPVILIPILATGAVSRSVSFVGQTPIADKQQSSTLILDAPRGDVCPLPPKVPPPKDGLHSSLDFVLDPSYRSRQVERLSRVVQVPSTSTELEDDPWSDYYAPFLDLHDELEKLFPLIHSYAKVEKVNRFGLAYTFNGTNSALKPALFMAHQDVVPIDDPDDWTYPPFSGYFDGQWLWGRGSSDCKNTLIGVLSAVEDLLKQGWNPTRTLVLSFGYDEESKGWKGAGRLAEHLENRYGKNSFEFIIDEGGMGIQTIGDKIYAVPGVGEKGSVDIHISLSIDGGHSSIPPAHTGIGIISEIIYHLEREDLFTPKLDLSHPSRQGLTCQAKHSADYVEPWLWPALESSDYTGLAEALAASRGERVRFLYQTSQAADLINGGVKINALPEKINATVNYRVAIHENTDVVRARAINIITPIAKAHNLTFSAFGSGNKRSANNNHLDISDFSLALEPAPISPTSPSDAIWARLSGVTRQFFETLTNKTVLVVGDVMTGNTDTRFYWNLTRNIWRFSPMRTGGSENIHTVDERVDIDVHLEGLAFYYELIRAFDKYED